MIHSVRLQFGNKERERSDHLGQHSFLLEEKENKEHFQELPVTIKSEMASALQKMFCIINFSLMTFWNAVLNPCQSLALNSDDVGDFNKHDPNLLPRLDSFITLCPGQFSSQIHKRVFCSCWLNLPLHWFPLFLEVCLQWFRYSQRLRSRCGQPPPPSKEPRRGL